MRATGNDAVTGGVEGALDKDQYGYLITSVTLHIMIL